jgi:site-specific recombinase XerD
VTVYLARLAPGSRRTMRQALGVIAMLCVPGPGEAPEPEAFPWWHLRAEHTKALRAQLAEHYRFSTANKMLSALRGVLREAWELGLMETDADHRAVAFRAVRGQRAAQATGRSLARGELRALIAACLEPRPARKGEPAALSDKGRRDAALVALGYGCGLRRDELASLLIGDVDLLARRVTARGKGNKERVVPIPPGAFRAVQAYLRVRIRGIRDHRAGLGGCGAGLRGEAREDAEERAPIYNVSPTAGDASPTASSVSPTAVADESGEGASSGRASAAPLFVRARRGGRLDAGADAITGQAVYYVLSTRARQAGVAAFSPHDLRRSYVGDLLDEGADLSVAQQLAGHASPATTAGYDRRGERAKEQAANRLDVPYDG